MKVILQLIEKAVNNNGIQDFKNYLKPLARCTKWKIFSDYCINDPNKPNNVATFTILPYYEHLDKIQKQISIIAPTDIKNTRCIRDSWINYHRSGLIFHFSFIWKKEEKLFNWVEKDHIDRDLTGLINMIQEWEIYTPAHKIYYDSIIKKVKKLQKMIKKKNFNLKLMNKILFISTIVAYVAYLLCKEIDVEIISWLSDRDEITTTHQGIVFDLFHLNHSFLCDRDKIDDSKIKVITGIPPVEDEKLWYDELIRLPDFISGTLADFDIEKNSVSKSKFADMLQKCIANNPNILIFKLSYDSYLDFLYYNQIKITLSIG